MLDLWEYSASRRWQLAATAQWRRTLMAFGTEGTGSPCRETFQQGLGRLTPTRSRRQEQHEELAHFGRGAPLGQLSAALVHQLAQPLMSILANAEAALQIAEQNGMVASQIKEILRDIIRDDTRAALMLQSLRSLLLRGETRRQPVDLNQLVRDALALLRSDLSAREVYVSLQLTPHPSSVLADGVQLLQVLLNLIVNACEAMPETPQTEHRLTIATQPGEDGRIIRCSVTDHGPGIAVQDLEQIFEPFVTSKDDRLGLGLAICRSIIEAHGGRVWAENASDCGAVFHFTAAVGL